MTKPYHLGCTGPPSPPTAMHFMCPSACPSRDLPVTLSEVRISIRFFTRWSLSLVLSSTGVGENVPCLEGKIDKLVECFPSREVHHETRAEERERERERGMCAIICTRLDITQLRCWALWVGRDEILLFQFSCRKFDFLHSNPDGKRD